MELYTRADHPGRTFTRAELDDLNRATALDDDDEIELEGFHDEED